eukprot:TRINITY_DN9960_c0_g1_i4.p1 TRINITY_DN9960_c0_g1~~TRINITY_DN9960_c0_g1_i4.p1  ORF type:complete len:417 (-),score=90.01 TRINITY_DN9960_c0_g1_i4:406-1656(-)
MDTTGGNNIFRNSFKARRSSSRNKLHADSVVSDSTSNSLSTSTTFVPIVFTEPPVTTPTTQADRSFQECEPPEVQQQEKPSEQLLEQPQPSSQLQLQQPSSKIQHLKQEQEQVQDIDIHLTQASQGIGEQVEQNLPETGTKKVEGSREPPEELDSTDGTKEGIGNLLKLQISIPHVQLNYTAGFAPDLTMRQLKELLLNKICNTERDNTSSSPNNYYLSVNKTHILDERIVLSEMCLEGDQIQLIRPFQYQIALVGRPKSDPLIVVPSSLCLEVAQKVTALAFKDLNASSHKIQISYDNGSGWCEVNNDLLFVSYGIRSKAKLKLQVTPLSGSSEPLEQHLRIDYSPFDFIDEQKKNYERSGWLTKQGGNKGGARTWMRRWFELGNKDGVDQLEYFDVTQKAKESLKWLMSSLYWT